jgi:hypothetical protein
MVIHCLQWTRIFINCRNHNSTILLSFMIYPGIWLITGFWTHVTRKVPLVEQENINLQFTPSVRGIRAGYTQCSSCSLHTVFVMQLTPSVRGIRAAYTQCSWDSCSLHPVFVVQLTHSVRRAAYTQCSSCSVHTVFVVQLTPSVRGIRAAYTQCSSCSLQCSWDSCSLHPVFVRFVQLTPSVRGIREAYTQCSWDSCSLHPVFVGFVQLTPSVRRAASTLVFSVVS